jgi:hypothetical protein
MIRSCCQQDQVISFDKPEVQATVEVRPKIRGAGAPPTVIVASPVTMSAQELRPETTEAAGPVTTAADKPVQTSVQELRPVIKKVEEE